MATQTEPDLSAAMPGEEPKTFVLGLAMAGAVSAGAYTAGVIDTLFRALAAHDEKYRKGEVPHRVVLKVMSGASAGSICAALGAVSLIDGVVPFKDENGAEELTGLPKLYDLWVEKIRLAPNAEDSDCLIGIEDLKKDGPVMSILNSRHIDNQAEIVLKQVVNSIDPEKPLGFIASELDILLTITQMQGVPYEIMFSDEPTGHLMASHGGVAHFCLKGAGSADISSPWLERWGDSGKPLFLPVKGAGLSFEGMWEQPSGRDAAFRELARSAVASGAFPLGLSSRLLATDGDELRSRAWPIESDPREGTLKLVLPETKDGILRYVAVDGGVANNEPFELARYTVRTAVNVEMSEEIGPDATSGRTVSRAAKHDSAKKKKWELEANPREADEATRAVIMIDPFPEGPKFKSVENDGQAGGLLEVLTGLMPALINQARFKPGELLNAMNQSVYSRFLIAPSRSEMAKNEDGGFKFVKRRGAQAIACGFSGGFGGFFDKRFREHDYRLGQQNARSFLLKYFVLDQDHDRYRFREWEQRAGKDLRRSASTRNPDLKSMIRILQIDEDQLPNFESDNLFDPPRPRGHPRWPVLERAAFEKGVGLVKERIQAVAARSTRSLELNFFRRQIAYFFWRHFERKLSQYLGGKLVKEMIEREQLERKMSEIEKSSKDEARALIEAEIALSYQRLEKLNESSPSPRDS